MATRTNAFQKMQLQEIEQRAWIFLQLKRSRDYARRRILQNLKWEFEFFPAASLEKKVDEIVAYVYKV